MKIQELGRDSKAYVHSSGGENLNNVALKRRWFRHWRQTYTEKDSKQSTTSIQAGGWYEKCKGDRNWLKIFQPPGLSGLFGAVSRPFLCRVKYRDLSNSWSK